MIPDESLIAHHLRVALDNVAAALELTGASEKFARLDAFTGASALALREAYSIAAEMETTHGS